MAVFVGLVFVAYAYIWRKGGFDWAHQDVTPSEPEDVIARERAFEDASRASAQEETAHAG
jgi:hypothetical protein